MPGIEDATSRTDLLQHLRDVAARCSAEAKPAADDLPAGFQNVDDVIVLLQPLRMNAEGDQAELVATLQRLTEKNFLTGTQAISEGGVWPALLCGCAAHARGFHAELSESEGPTAVAALLAEQPARALVSTRPKAHVPLANFVEHGRRFTAEAIGRVTAGDVRVRWMGETLFEAPSLDALTR